MGDVTLIAVGMIMLSVAFALVELLVVTRVGVIKAPFQEE
jgi:hypothetical protein